MSNPQHRNPFTGLLAALLAVSSVAVPIYAADWPQFRGPNRDGKSAETGLLARWPLAGPKLLGSVTGVGAGFTHVSAATRLILCFSGRRCSTSLIAR
jgi:outer membrane protein assembly factor BamB